MRKIFAAIRVAAVLSSVCFLLSFAADASTINVCASAAIKTIQGGVNAANAGDTVSVCAGTYAEAVTVNKSITLSGAQAGVDARNGRPAAPESIVDGTTSGGKTPFDVTVSNVVIDGFTLTGATSAAQFGCALLVSGGVSGTHIVNNIISNSITGIYLANGAGNPALIQHNLIENNNVAGPVSGTGIYSDQFAAGGTLQNVTIDANTFSGNTLSGIFLSSTDVLHPSTNMTISNNLFNGNAASVLMYSTTNSTVTGNTMQNSNSSSADIGLFEGVDTVSITSNTLTSGTGRALHALNSGSGPPNPTNVTFTGNSMTSYTGAMAIVQVDSYTGSLNATCNWWGSSTGPTNAGNPGGTGQSVSAGATFLPWLVAPPPGGVCVGGDTMTTFQGSMQSATVNTAFGTPLKVQVFAGASPAPGVSVTFASPLSGPSGTFAGSTTVMTDASGFATAPTLTANTIVGSYMVTASAGATLSTTFQLTNTAGPATTFAVAAPSNATTGTAFSFTVTAHDMFGNTASGYGGIMHFSSTDNLAVLPANSSLTNGTGTFSATLKTAGSQTITATDTLTSAITGNSNSIAVHPPATRADFNGDGKADITLRDTSGTASTGSVFVMLMSGSSILSTQQVDSADPNYNVAGTGDFDGDGKADILLHDTNGSLGLWFMNGAAIASGKFVGSPGAGYTVAGVGDFDGDGKMDILLRDSNGSLGIWFNAASTFTGAFVGTPGAGYSVAGVGDFDGDGKADILLRDSLGNLGIWFMNGATIKSGAYAGAAGASYTVAGVGDFNGDGKADILLRDNLGNIGMWLMNGATIQASAFVGSPGGTYTVASVNDYNGDGKADILIVDATGHIGMWLMNGSAITAGASVATVGSGYTLY